MYSIKNTTLNKQGDINENTILPNQNRHESNYVCR